MNDEKTTVCNRLKGTKMTGSCGKEGMSVYIRLMDQRSYILLTDGKVRDNRSAEWRGWDEGKMDQHRLYTKKQTMKK